MCNVKESWADFVVTGKNPASTLCFLLSQSGARFSSRLRTFSTFGTFTFAKFPKSFGWILKIASDYKRRGLILLNKVGLKGCFWVGILQVFWWKWSGWVRGFHACFPQIPVVLQMRREDQIFAFSSIQLTLNWIVRQIGNSNENQVSVILTKPQNTRKRTTFSRNFGGFVVDHSPPS